VNREVAACVLLLLAGPAMAADVFPPPSAPGEARADVPEGKRMRAAKLADKAKAAFDAGRLRAAENLARRALKLDPDAPPALYIAGSILNRAAVAGRRGQAPEELRAERNRNYRRFVDLEPTGLLASIARTLLAGPSLPAVLPEPNPRCPRDAQAHWDEAERRLAAEDLGGAGREYDLAIETCSANAKLQLYSGDALFSQGDLDGALERYETALGLAPCYWVAHRFSADVLLRRGDTLEGLKSLAASVACNPWYGPGRSFLEEYAEQFGLPMAWPEARGPALSVEDGELGIEPHADPSRPGGAAWLLYGLVKGVLTDPAVAAVLEDELEDLDSQLSARADSPLAVETTAILLAMKAFQSEDGELEIPDGDDAHAFRVFRDAIETDMLDEAIFMVIADPALAPEFARHTATAEGREALLAFVTLLVAGRTQ
jgi:tetratricopeptide (TPR) repeat protein